MSSLKLEEIEEIVSNVMENSEDQDLYSKLIGAFQNRFLEKEQEKEEKKSSKKSAKEWAIIRNTSNDDFYVVQVGEDGFGAPCSNVQKALKDSVSEYNVTPKGDKNPVFTVRQMFKSVKAGLFKDKGVFIKSKEPVVVINVDDEDIQG